MTISPGHPTPAAVLLNVVVLAGMLVVGPVGLRMIAEPGLAWIWRFWPVGAVAGGACLWIDRGPVAAGLAAGYALLTLALAAHVPLRLLRRRELSAREAAVLTAMAAPAVAGVALVAERAGYRLFGFKLEILALTVPHFHYAGFAAALVAGLVCRAVGDGSAAKAAALTVPGGTALVFVGYFTGDLVELAGTAVLTGGMWLVAWSTWHELRPAVADRAARILLATAATILVVTMLLALNWALGEATGLPHLSVGWMVATHGVANAFGFGLCMLLALRRVRVEPL